VVQSDSEEKLNKELIACRLQLQQAVEKNAEIRLENNTVLEDKTALENMIREAEGAVHAFNEIVGECQMCTDKCHKRFAAPPEVDLMDMDGVKEDGMVSST